LTKQHGAVQYELTVAKENTSALQELVEVYQRKVRDGAVAGLASTPALEASAPKPFDPATRRRTCRLQTLQSSPPRPQQHQPLRPHRFRKSRLPSLKTLVGFPASRSGSFPSGVRFFHSGAPTSVIRIGYPASSLHRNFPRSLCGIRISWLDSLASLIARRITNRS
jgi:hypothetical protein